MRISATGSHRRRPDRQRAVGGFTLLELVVVIAIIGTMVVLVRLQAPDRARQRMALEADRFVHMLDDCRLTAVLSATPTGVRITGAAYELVRYRGAWQAQSEESHALPPEIVLALHKAPAAKHLSDQRVRAVPSVVCLPTGEAILPPLRLSHRGKAGYFEFGADLDGQYIATWVAGPV